MSDIERAVERLRSFIADVMCGNELAKYLDSLEIDLPLVLDSHAELERRMAESEKQCPSCKDWKQNFMAVKRERDHLRSQLAQASTRYIELCEYMGKCRSQFANETGVKLLDCIQQQLAINPKCGHLMGEWVDDNSTAGGGVEQLTAGTSYCRHCAALEAQRLSDQKVVRDVLERAAQITEQGYFEQEGVDSRPYFPQMLKARAANIRALQPKPIMETSTATLSNQKIREEAWNEAAALVCNCMLPGAAGGYSHTCVIHAEMKQRNIPITEGQAK